MCGVLWMTTASDPPIINITGEKIALGPIRRDLVPLYLRWINDFEVTRTMGIGWRPMTQEAEEAWYERACDTIYMDCLATEFESPLLEEVLNGLAGSGVDEELP